MKKTFVGLLSAAVVGLLLPSCLGDGGESSYEGTREFGVVSVSEGLTQASMASGIIITGGDIDNYSSGDVVLASFKVNTANYINSTTIRVDYATVDDETDAFVNSSQKSVIVGDYTYEANEDNSFTGVTAQYGYSTEFFMNRWLISVSATLQKDVSITGINLYYNKDDQTPSDGSTLPDDAIILDVELLKTTSASGTTETSSKTQSVAVNLTTLRDLNIKGMEDSSSTQTMKIWLRYPKYTTSTKAYSKAIIQNAMGITYTASSN